MKNIKNTGLSKILIGIEVVSVVSIIIFPVLGIMAIISLIALGMASNKLKENDIIRYQRYQNYSKIILISGAIIQIAISITIFFIGSIKII